MSDIIQATALTPEELADWRRRNGKKAPAPRVSSVVVDTPTKQRPLSAGDTQVQTREWILRNMRENRDTHAAAMRWLRMRNPTMYQHMTDEQLAEHLDSITRQATTRALRQNGRMKAGVLDGIY